MSSFLFKRSLFSGVFYRMRRHYDTDPKYPGGLSAQDISNLAEKLLERHYIAEPPVNVEMLIDFDVCVSLHDAVALSGDVVVGCGVVLLEDGRYNIVYHGLRSSEASSEQRFMERYCLAKEYGRTLLDREAGAKGIYVASGNQDKAHCKLCEEALNLFVFFLLVPCSMLRPFVKFKRLDNICEEFDVSQDFVRRRLFFDGISDA